jgi:hypothetical protein
MSKSCRGASAVQVIRVGFLPARPTRRPSDSISAMRPIARTRPNRVDPPSILSGPVRASTHRSARRSPAAVAVDEPGGALVGKPTFQTPHRPDRQTQQSGRLGDINPPAITFVSPHHRRCSIVVIVEGGGDPAAAAQRLGERMATRGASGYPRGRRSTLKSRWARSFARASLQTSMASAQASMAPGRSSGNGPSSSSSLLP